MSRSDIALGQGTDRTEWATHYRRAQRALALSVRWIGSVIALVDASQDRAEVRPVHTSGRLNRATRRLAGAGAQLVRASRALAAAHGAPPELVALAAERWQAVAGQLREATGAVTARQLEVLEGLASGTLVAEPSAGRPRIRLAPRPVSIRTLLASRRKRAGDRIAVILRRRRRTPRPPALQVPPPTSQGRAPPPSSPAFAF